MVSNFSNSGFNAGSGLQALPVVPQTQPGLPAVAAGMFANLGLINYAGPAGNSGNLFGLLELANGLGNLNPLSASPVLANSPFGLPSSSLFQSPLQPPLMGQLSTGLSALMAAFSRLMGGSPALPGAIPSVTPTAGNPLVSNAGAIGNADAGQPLAPGARPPRIAQIDDFTTDNTGFNHGQEVAKTLNPDGSASLLQLNIGGGGDRLANISSSLDNVLTRLKQGETIDAVNLSQQDFGNGPEAAQIRAKLDAISALGVPVAVAAGNNGPGQKNDLVSSHAFSVGSTTNGQLNPDSGLGNVTAEGRTTSFATANFARQIAIRHAAGLNVTA